jgi:hypothetical protein
MEHVRTDFLRNTGIQKDSKVQTMPLKEGVPLKLVTRKGECFEISFQRDEVPYNRDGTSYLFRLNDLTDKKPVNVSF